jgi:flavin reductase (DIM6/NTAB) family NADH-FMN oxidoreductase RutF
LIKVLDYDIINLKELKKMQKEMWPAGTMLSPVPPALVSLGKGKEANIITIAWTGIINSKPPMTYISVRPERHSYKILEKTGEFVINLAPDSICRAVDLCGVISGKDGDKFKKAGLTPQKSNKVLCPQIAECPISLECKVVDRKDLGSHTMFIAKIECVNVGKEFIDEKGKLDVEKMNLTAYLHGSYYSLGKRLGTFGFSVKKKKKR